MCRFQVLCSSWVMWIRSLCVITLQSFLYIFNYFNHFFIIIYFYFFMCSGWSSSTFFFIFLFWYSLLCILFIMVFIVFQCPFLVFKVFSCFFSSKYCHCFHGLSTSFHRISRPCQNFHDFSMSFNSFQGLIIVFKLYSGFRGFQGPFMIFYWFLCMNGQILVKSTFLANIVTQWWWDHSKCSRNEQ